VRNRCISPVAHKGVRWAPLSPDLPPACDLYIGSRSYRVIRLVRCVGRRLFWLHNPAGYLKKQRYLWRLACYRPTIVATGVYHAATVPRWLPCGGREVIPYGVLERFRTAPPRDPPPPRAIFTSNPTRGLDWLLDLWAARIKPAVPNAELHIYAGGAVYGLAGTPRARHIEEVLAHADSFAPCGVRRFPPVGREALVNALLGARVMLYRGDPGETFCLALAEAQAMGVPAVVTPLGATPERLVDGVTGRVAHDDAEFVAAAVALLRDDELWRRWHLAALERQRGLSWDDVAARFEGLMARSSQ
jgi:glycosyltransferase involved in cell wall biosynthesis